MTDQTLAAIVLQKRLLDGDLSRRTIAILMSGLAGLIFLSPGQILLYFGLYFPCDLALSWLIQRPRSP